MHLQERVPVLDIVGEKLVKYYTFYVTDPDTSILVSLTATGEGDPDLSVSKGIDSRPTLDDANWVSQNPTVDYIVISAKQNPGRFQRIDNTTGHYVVAVYGYHKAQYSLTYTTGDLTILTALANQPVDLHLKKRGQAVYLTYYHYSHDSFSVSLNRVTGAAEIAVTLMPVSKSSSSNKPSTSTSTSDTTTDFIRQLPHPTVQPVTSTGVKITPYWSSH